MAALPETPKVGVPEIQLMDLRSISARELAPLLAEEVIVWRDALNWDLEPSVELILRFVGMQALNGCALRQGARILGYTYFIREEHKGLIGDLYVVEHPQRAELEHALLEGAVTSMLGTPGVRRVETQLLMLGSLDRLTGRPFSGQGRPLPFANWFNFYPRLFLEIPAARATHLPARSLSGGTFGVMSGVTIAPWLEAQQEPSSWLVAVAYKGHVDSELNDQYRSPAGARRFLTNIIQYPGCGTFFSQASYAAFDTRTGALCGISLASQVAGDSGHITQLCVAPSHRGMGLGYELLRRSLLAFAAHRCRTVSLTVTGSNRDAIRLYEKMGFTQKREFAAYVWDAEQAKTGKSQNL